MEIKYSIQGILIYLTMTAYLMALFARLIRNKSFTYFSFTLGFIIAAISLGYRCWHTAHVPFQNLFEVFLVMGWAIYLISIFCRKTLKIKQTTADILLGIIVLFPAGFVFSDHPQQLQPILQSPFFAPHVAAYILAYIFMFKAAIAAVNGLFSKNPRDLSLDTYHLICAGFPLLTLGFVLGSIWAHYAWADFWGWDPKEMWALTTWLTYIAFFNFRFITKNRHPHINSFWAISGLLAIIITLLWANLSSIFSSLHSYAT